MKAETSEIVIIARISLWWMYPHSLLRMCGVNAPFCSGFRFLLSDWTCSWLMTGPASDGQLFVTRIHYAHLTTQHRLQNETSHSVSRNSTFIINHSFYRQINFLASFSVLPGIFCASSSVILFLIIMVCNFFYLLVTAPPI